MVFIATIFLSSLVSAYKYLPFSEKRKTGDGEQVAIFLHGAKNGTRSSDGIAGANLSRTTSTNLDGPASLQVSPSDLIAATTHQKPQSSFVAMSLLKVSSKFTQDELKKMINEPGQEQTDGGYIVGDGAFVRYKVSNCLGRWVDDSDKQRALMVLGKDGKPNDFECTDDLKAEATDARGQMECPGAFWVSDECKKALMAMKMELFERLVDFEDNWVLDSKGGDKCGFLHHYIMKVKYTVLKPTTKTLAAAPEIAPSSEWYGGMCKNKDLKECKITKGMILMMGASSEYDVEPEDLSDQIFQSKYTTCDPKQKKMLEDSQSDLEDSESEASNPGGLIFTFLLASAGSLLF